MNWPEKHNPNLPIGGIDCRQDISFVQIDLGVVAKHYDDDERLSQELRKLAEKLGHEETGIVFME